MAAVDLTPKQPRKAYGGDGGAYYEWSPADLPMLGVASIGAAKLSLAAGGLALPSYSDSAKVAYVLQGMIDHRLLLCSYLLQHLTAAGQVQYVADAGVCLVLRLDLNLFGQVRLDWEEVVVGCVTS
jgi:hypothetical protein